MKLYFDRTEPYYYSAEPTFDGNVVEVAEFVMPMLAKRKLTLKQMDEAIQEAGAPEDSAQELSNLFVSLLMEEIDNG